MKHRVVFAGCAVFAELAIAVAIAGCQSGRPPDSAAAAATATASEPGSAAATVATGTPSSAAARPLPESVTFPSGKLTLHGFLYRPPGPGPFAAIVYNHGSEEQPGAKDGQALF